MKRYADFSDFSKMSLAQIEKTLESYLKIAEDSDWDITNAFQKDLEMLTMLAKQKGSTKRWQDPGTGRRTTPSQAFFACVLTNF